MSENPIVVGTDGESRAELAVDKAGELALALGAPVHVACVPSAIYGSDWPPRISAQQIVTESAERLRSRGVTVETHLPKGEASLELAGLAEELGAQLIVMGNKGMTGIRRILGSLPNRVSHQARCDVLIVPTQSGTLPDYAGRAVVVGVEAAGDADRALGVAVRLARGLGGELHIVSGEGTGGVLAAAAAAAARQGVPVLTHEVDGELSETLLDVATEHDAALVVVDGRGMHAEDRERFRNTPDQLSHQGAISVLISYAGGAEGEAMSAGRAEAASA